VTVTIVTALTAAIVAAVITYLVARSQAGRELAEARAAWATELATARQDNKWLQQEIERERESAGATQTLLDTAERQLREAFQSLAAEALHANRGAFLDQARATFEGFKQETTAQIEARHKAIDSLVQPIAESLKTVEHRLGETEKSRIDSYARLAEQLAALDSNTQTLARALHTPSVRGRWGEMQLRRVVELAGMLHRCDFEEQPSLFSEAGRLRPDLIVHLPGGKQMVVDSKAPLEAFLNAHATHDEDERIGYLRDHARQVRAHMDKLGGKAYWGQLAQSPELVVMFLPGETLFSTALQHDLSLIEYGLQQRVLLASPITLIALLTTVAHGWRQEALADNYREVATLGREFYDRVAKFTEYFDDVRRKLDGAVQAYNQAAGSFESRVLVSARRLRDLDVTTSPEIPSVEPIDRVPRVLVATEPIAVPEEAAPEPDLAELKPGKI
jgi:DNA recombination protein RmuC